MVNKIKTVLIQVFLFCTCSLCTYGQETECIQKFAEFAKKVDELNQSNLSVLEQASRDNRDVTESQLKELQLQAQTLTKEAIALQSEFAENGIVINQLPQGLEILSDMRFRTLSKTAQFRKIWKEMRERKIIMEPEEVISRKWSFFNLKIRDSDMLHSDTEKRIRDCITHIKNYSDSIALLLMKSSSGTDEGEAASRIVEFIEAMKMEYLIACEYITDDPVGAEAIKKELDEIVTMKEDGQLGIKF